MTASIHTKACAKPHMQMLGSFIWSSPNLETTQIPIDRCLDKQILVHPSKGTLVSNKKERTIDSCNDLDDSQGNYVEWKKPGQKKRVHAV